MGVVGGVAEFAATFSNFATASLTFPRLTDPFHCSSLRESVIVPVFCTLIARSGSKDRPEGMNRFGTSTSGFLPCVDGLAFGAVGKDGERAT